MLMISRKYLLLLFVVLLLYGCSKETVELRNVVTAYNKMLVEALSKPDSRLMEYFVTTKEMLRIESYITYLKKDKKLLVSELKKIEFLDTAINDDRAAVKTKEEWLYHYIDSKTRQPVTDKETIAYENTYHLIRDGERWVVDRVDIKEQ